jgi:hypothetical protein
MGTRTRQQFTSGVQNGVSSVTGKLHGHELLPECKADNCSRFASTLCHVDSGPAKD